MATAIYSLNNPRQFRQSLNFYHILRNILRLKNNRAVYKKEDILRALAAEFNIDISCMSKMLEAKKANKRLPGKIAAELFNSFVGDLEKIARC